LAALRLNIKQPYGCLDFFSEEDMKIKFLFGLLLIGLLVFSGCTNPADNEPGEEQPFVDNFDGTKEDQWTVYRTAPWANEEGELVLRSFGFLDWAWYVYEHEYADFTVEFDLKFQTDLVGSGINIFQVYLRASDISDDDDHGLAKGYIINSDRAFAVLGKSEGADLVLGHEWANGFSQVDSTPGAISLGFYSGVPTHWKIEVAGNVIKVWFNNSATPRIAVRDDNNTFTSGYFAFTALTPATADEEAIRIDNFVITPITAEAE
jgi:hypothetical protein